MNGADNSLVIIDLKEIYELADGLRQQGKSENEKVELLKRIAYKLQPYLRRISKPIKLRWGLRDTEEARVPFIPESEETLATKELYSNEGIVLWPADEASPRGDQLWLLSSGRFLYIKSKHELKGGDGWGWESWVGEPFESDDPFQFAPNLVRAYYMDTIYENIISALTPVLWKVVEIDEDTFKLMLNFPLRSLLGFLLYSSGSNSILTRFGEKYVRNLLIGILNESEDNYICNDALKILNKISRVKTMLAILQAIPPKDGSSTHERALMQDTIRRWSEIQSRRMFKEPVYNFVVEAPTVEEAMKKGEERLPANAMDVEFKVLDSGDRGFIRIGKKPAKVGVAFIELEPTTTGARVR
jgi:hypothetical protein